MRNKRSGINYVAYLAALEVEKYQPEDLKKFLKSFLDNYTDGVRLGEDVYNKFYLLTEKELEQA